MSQTRQTIIPLQDKISISPIDDIIADIADGKMVIIVDDENRENEGDLVIAAHHVTPSHINFMATFGRGLICLAMDHAMINRLELPDMVDRNRDPYATAFTVSIDAKDGVSTGISAFDRAKTIQVAIDSCATPNDIVTPGHVFPLRAKHNGVLDRPGHTEAAVDLSKLAHLPSAGVICEIMRDDGEMARLPDLMVFAQNHKLKIGTIADLVAYRTGLEAAA